MKRAICLLMALCFGMTSCSTVCKRPDESVMISSDPPGAKVIIDGKERGVTPSSVELNPRYSHRVILEKEGWKSQEFTIRSRISGQRLGSNIFLPITALIAAGGVGLYCTGGATSGMAGLGVMACLAVGAAVGVAALVVGTGVDLYSGKAKKLHTTRIEAKLEPATLQPLH